MAQVEERLADVPEGDGMDPLDAALVRLAVSVSVTCLDSEAIDEAVVAALESGATAAQVQEVVRSEEHTSELQSLMRISYAVFCLKKKKTKSHHNHQRTVNK